MPSFAHRQQQHVRAMTDHCGISQQCYLFQVCFALSYLMGRHRKGRDVLISGAQRLDKKYQSQGGTQEIPIGYEEKFFTQMLVKCWTRAQRGCGISITGTIQNSDILPSSLLSQTCSEPWCGLGTSRLPHHPTAISDSDVDAQLLHHWSLSLRSAPHCKAQEFCSHG